MLIAPDSSSPRKRRSSSHRCGSKTTASPFRRPYRLLRFNSWSRRGWRLVFGCDITGACGSTRGGLTAERQRFREELRLEAAERFANGEASSVIAEDLRVSVRSVQRWRRMWDENSPRALRPQGPASLPRLSKRQFTQRGPRALAQTDVHRGTDLLQTRPQVEADLPAEAGRRQP